MSRVQIARGQRRPKKACGHGARTKMMAGENIRHPDSAEFGSGTVAGQIGKEIWVGSFRGDRIARFPAAQ
jgi:hypothetical protein